MCENFWEGAAKNCSCLEPTKGLMCTAYWCHAFTTAYTCVITITSLSQLSGLSQVPHAHSAKIKSPARANQWIVAISLRVCVHVCEGRLKIT